MGRSSVSRVEVELLMRRMDDLLDAQRREEWPMRSTIREVREGYRCLARVVTDYMDGMEERTL